MECKLKLPLNFERPMSFSSLEIPMGVWETNIHHHQPLPPFFLLFYFPSHLSLSLFVSLSLSLSFSFYLGRHPGQIVALKISLKGCWWSILPSLSKCAQVHLTVHCLEMDYWSWKNKRQEKEGIQEGEKTGLGRSTYLSSRWRKSLFEVSK